MFSWFKRPIKNIINIGDKVLFNEMTTRDCNNMSYDNLYKGVVISKKSGRYAIKRDNGSMVMKNSYDVFKDNE
jgi:hypothetical protein